MNEWGWNPSTIQAAGAFAVAFGLVFAIAGIIFSELQNRRSRNLQAILTISMDMRDRWEHGWESVLRVQAPNIDLEARQEGEVGRQLKYMLNWLEWMGVMIKNGWIEKQLVIDTLYSVVVEILSVNAHLIQFDIDNPDRGERWWANALYIARLPEIDVNIAAKAEELRREWNWPKENITDRING